MDFEQRLRELESMTGQDVSMDLFNLHYEEMLREIQTGPGPRYGRLERMQRLIHRQTAWVMCELIREKAIEKMGMGRMDTAIMEESVN